MEQTSWQAGRVTQHVNHGEVTTAKRLFFSLLVIYSAPSVCRGRYTDVHFMQTHKKLMNKLES